MAQPEPLTVESPALGGVPDHVSELLPADSLRSVSSPATLRAEAMSESKLQSAYDGSNILFRVLLMHGWGPLLNLGYFDLFSPFTFFSLPVAQRRLIRKSVQLLRLQRDETVLDVACGRGWSTNYIASSQPVRRVVGVDFLENHVRVCRTLYGNLPRVEYQQGDATNLRFEDESFDAVVCIEAAFHFDRRKFISEAARVLRKGGRLVIVDFMWKTRPVPHELNHPHADTVRSIWSWNDFDSVDEYRSHAANARFRIKSLYDWSRPVTATMHVLCHVMAAAGRNGIGRSLLSWVNQELRRLGQSDWRELREIVRAHGYVRNRASYMAMTLIKD